MSDFELWLGLMAICIFGIFGGWVAHAETQSRKTKPTDSYAYTYMVMGDEHFIYGMVLATDDDDAEIKIEKRFHKSYPGERILKSDATVIVWSSNVWLDNGVLRGR